MKVIIYLSILLIMVHAQSQTDEKDLSWQIDAQEFEKSVSKEQSADEEMNLDHYKDSTNNKNEDNILLRMRRYRRCKQIFRPDGTIKLVCYKIPHRPSYHPDTNGQDIYL